VAAVQYTFAHKQHTEYRERNIHNNQKIGIYIKINKFKTNLGSAGRAPSLAFALQLRKKHNNWGKSILRHAVKLTGVLGLHFKTA
jgi:phage portal protein BeeE